MDAPIIDPSKVQALIAGGLGAFLSVLFRRDSNKLSIFTTLITAEIVAYYFGHPVWVLLHTTFTWADDQWQGPVSLSLGLVAIFIVGGIMKVAADFWKDPLNTISTVAVTIIQRLTPAKKEEK